MNTKKLNALTRLIRHWILKSTNHAASGHPTSSLSSVELMTALMFGESFRFDPSNPDHPNNDRLIFSKGHASPLFYALWLAADQIDEEEMMTYRQFGSRLEGHPVMSFPFTEAATGSLGQGLSVGVGMALNGKYVDELPYRTYVLLGDSEMAEGSQWEAIQLAAFYKLDNLIGILDVNRLGQRGETMYAHELSAYRKRVEAFGWETVTVENGHDLEPLLDAYRKALRVAGKPVMLIAGTIKGKGIPSVEDRDGWHGKALGEDALKEFDESSGYLDSTVRGKLAVPDDLQPAGKQPESLSMVSAKRGDQVATRDAYGTGLKRLYPAFPEIVVLDGEVSNSTRAQKFREAYPNRFFEMFVAEQNMVGAAIGFSRRGKLPFVSTFAAFLTRSFDQIRMSRYSEATIVFAGSHAGCSIGKDGPSQMGLEDIALFRAIPDSVVLYPSDAVATEKVMEFVAAHKGISYLRLTRSKTEVIYGPHEQFPVGGSKTLMESDQDVLTIVTAGYTLHEALAAAKTLKEDGVAVRVIDLYSIKPLDVEVLEKAADETGRLLVIEDHYPQGGIGEAVIATLKGKHLQLEHLAVTKQPGSGAPEEVLKDQGLDSESIYVRVKSLLGTVQK